jgi:hypothetical protein
MIEKLSKKEFNCYVDDFRKAERTGSWVAIAEEIQYSYLKMNHKEWQHFLVEIGVSENDAKKLSSALDDFRLRVFEARENLQEHEYFSEDELEQDMLRNCEVY